VPLALRPPLNIAHRGANETAPENTLAAFHKALDLGADGIELDVRLSADGVPVVIHDATVDRTTDGAGPVAGMDLGQLRALDAGGWFDPGFTGERIPTLEEVLGVFGGRTWLNLELKGVRILDDELVSAVAGVLGQLELAQDVLISSFNPYLLRQVRRLAPSYPVALLYASSPLLLRQLGQLLLGSRPAAVHPHHALVNRQRVARAHKVGTRVNVWTVDARGRMQELISAGVDGIITNQPALLREVLRG
jgi:glycerophosphoryl diester phosphodiesterase